MIPRTRLAVIVAVVGLVLLVADTAFALPNYPHTSTFKNTTGAAVNDLHVDVPHTVIKASAPPFPNAALDSPNIGDVMFSGANVANGASVTATVTTKFASDVIDKDSSFWTLNGANVGAVASNAGHIHPQYVTQGDGSILVQLVNPDAATSYTNLAIYTQALNLTANENNYLSVAAANGNLVPLLVPSTGTLPTGTTSIAQFFASTASNRFDAGSMFFGGDVFGAGDNVPEPASGIVVLLAGMGLVLRRGRVRPHC